MIDALASLVRLDVLVDSSTDGESDRAAGYPVAPDAPEVPAPVKRRQSYPYYSRPPDGAEIILAACGGGINNRAYLASHVYGNTPELEKGEAETKTIFGQRIKLSQDGRITLLTSHGSKIECKEDGSVVLTASNGKATLANGILSVEDVVAAQHFAGRGGAPSAAAGAGLGSGGTVTVDGSSSDAGLKITLKAGTMGMAPGTLCTVTFAKPYASAPCGFGLAPRNALAANAGAPPMAGTFYIENVTTTQFEIATTGTPAANASYELSVVVLQ